MSESEYGDENFKDFMDKSSELKIVINTIRYKIKSIIELYSSSLNTYLKLNNEDPLKKELREYLLELFKHSLQAIDQFDYALLGDDDQNERDT